MVEEIKMVIGKIIVKSMGKSLQQLTVVVLCEVEKLIQNSEIRA